MGRGTKRLCAADAVDEPPSAALRPHVLHCWRAGAGSTGRQMWDETIISKMRQLDKRLHVPQHRGFLAPVPYFDSGEDVSLPAPLASASAFSLAGLRLAGPSASADWTSKMQRERRAAIKKWASLVKMHPAAWEVGRQQVSVLQLRVKSGGLFESISDALASKATATLHGRAGPLLRYSNFWIGQGHDPWPLQEGMVYAYFKEVGPSTAPTHLRSCLISMSFAMHVLGLYGVRSVLESGRVRGVSAEHFSRKRALRQRDPLTVMQVIVLERCVMDGTAADKDRVAAGFFLVCIYGRLRYSDALHINSVKLDVQRVQGKVIGFLEATCKRTKTMMSLETKTRLLPVAVPIQSVGDTAWVETWLELRERIGLVVDDKCPLLSAPMVNGQWGSLPLGAAEAGHWLRWLVAPAGVQEQNLARCTRACI